MGGCNSNNGNNKATGNCQKPVKAGCVVKINVSKDWNGEFGFDAYDGILASAFVQSFDANDELINEYDHHSCELPVEKDKTYFAPWINLFPQDFGDGDLSVTACFDLNITIENVIPDRLFIQLPAGIVGCLGKKLVGQKSTIDFKSRIGDNTIPFCIKCLTASDQKRVINIVAQINGKSYLVGKAIVCPNNHEHLKTRKIVIVKTITDIDVHAIATKYPKGSGILSNKEEKGLINALAQALIHCDLEYAQDLNLKNNENFGKQGRYCTIYKDNYHLDVSDKRNLFDDLIAFFKQQNPVGIYEKAVIVFVFDTGAFSDYTILGLVGGITNDVGSPFSIIFPGRDRTTLSHEVLHGMGLDHSFLNLTATQRDINKAHLPNQKYVFLQGNTKNVMDYNEGNSLWKWQWEKINP